MRAKLPAGLAVFNVLVGGMQTGFGAFLGPYLALNGWAQTDIGLAQSVGTTAAAISQVPAGAIVDAVPDKRWAASAAILATIGALVLLIVAPTGWLVFAALAIQNAAGGMLAPAIAAITLALGSRGRLGERLGGNVRFTALGAAGAALVLGAAGEGISADAIFYAAGAFGLLALPVLFTVRPRAGTRVTKASQVKPGRVFADPRLLLFASIVALFQFANAPLLLIALVERTHATGKVPAILTTVLIVLPQLLAAAVAQRIGHVAQSRGRRPLLIGALAAVCLRALLFAWSPSVPILIAATVLDGLTAAAIGILQPLVVSDLTPKGRFTLAIGVIGLSVAFGAAVGTALAGRIVDRLGAPAAFLTLAGVAAAAGLMATFLMTETRTDRRAIDRHERRRRAARQLRRHLDDVSARSPGVTG